jgi:hypothetical protein
MADAVRVTLSRPWRVRWLLAAAIAAFWLTSVYAAPIDPGDGTPGQQRAQACADQTLTTFIADPPSYDLTDPDTKSTLRWSVHIPPPCTATLTRLLLDGVPVQRRHCTR